MRYDPRAPGERAFPDMTPEAKAQLWGTTDAVEDFIQRTRVKRAAAEAYHIRRTGKAKRPATRAEMLAAAENAVKRHQYGMIVDPAALLYILKSS